MKKATGPRRKAYVNERLQKTGPGLHKILSHSQALLYCTIYNTGPYKRLGIFPPKSLSYQIVIPNYLTNRGFYSYHIDVRSNMHHW